MALLSFRGTGASPGIGEGRALVYGRQSGLAPAQPWAADGAAVPATHLPAGPAERDVELERFRSALRAASTQPSEVSGTMRNRVGDEQAAVFEAQSLFLQDPALMQPVEEAIRVQGVTAVTAIRRVFENAAAELESVTDTYLAARATDIRDVEMRLLGLLNEPAAVPSHNLHGETVIIARDLTPSDTVALPLDLVRGVVLAEGTPAAHAAILARGLGLPLVVGAGANIFQVVSGQSVLVDGTAGTVLVEPRAEERVTRQVAAVGAAQAEAGEEDHGPVLTRDGRRIEILANASSAVEARMACRNGAEGIGLLRTEFLLAALTRGAGGPGAGADGGPGGDALSAAYAGIFRAAGTRPVTVRVMDAGGDKPLPFLSFGREDNPFLGWRGIRILLDEPELFAAQLRAVLDAAATTSTDLRLMLPMVSTVEELTRARAIVHEVCRVEDVTLAHPLRIGVMIETPAAALIAAALAGEADFFSIGTNDLVQYTLACDRGNPRVVGLCRPEHPAVLRLIDMTARAAHAAGIPVGLCGEAAGDPALLALLLGLGIDELSVGPARLPTVRAAVRSIDCDRAAALASEALACATADEVLALMPDGPDPAPNGE